MLRVLCILPARGHISCLWTPDAACASTWVQVNFLTKAVI